MAGEPFTFDPGPDPRAVAFLEGKGLQRSYRWASMWQTEHAYGFTLAGVYRLDVLSAAKELVTQAVANGETLEGFRSQFEDRLQKLGFAGPQTVGEFAEGPREVNLSAPWRTKVIYDTNVRQAYAASEWQAIDDTKAEFPALQYHHTPQAHPRQQHLAWDRLVLPVDHVFWKTHFPPNGWYCKCFVLQVSSRELANGETKLSTDDQLQATGYQDNPAQWPQWRDQATGRTERVPDGVTPGFAFNAGQDRRANLGDLLTRRVAGLDPDMARAASADLVNFPPFADLVDDAVSLGQARAAAQDKVAANLAGGSATRAEISRLSQAAADDAGVYPKDSWPVAVVPADLRGADDASVVVANASAIGHSADLHPTTPADWRRVQLMLEHGQVLRGPSGELTLFAQFRDGAGPERTWTAVIKPVDGAWRVKTMFESSPRRQAKVVARLDPVRAGGAVIDLVGKSGG